MKEYIQGVLKWFATTENFHMYFPNRLSKLFAPFCRELNFAFSGALRVPLHVIMQSHLIEWIKPLFSFNRESSSIIQNSEISWSLIPMIWMMCIERLWTEESNFIDLNWMSSHDRYISSRWLLDFSHGFI